MLNSIIKNRIEKIEEGIVPEGYKKTKIGIIPEDWEVKSLGDIRDFNDRHSFAGGPFGSNLKVKDYRSEGIRIIQLQNIGDGYFDNRNQIYTSVEKADELISSNIYPGEIIIAKMAEPLARACIIPDYEERYLMASDGIRLKLNDDNNTLYMKEIINGSRFRNQAYQLGTGTTRKRISLTELRKILVPNPPLQEQGKIADILSIWDKAIENIEKLIKEKEVQKKGLMQQLLTGETRLPGFSGKWGKNKLGDVVDFKQGYQVAVKDQFDIKKSDNYERFIRIIDVTQRNEEKRYIEVDKFMDKVNVNDLFMVRYGTPGIVAIGYEGIIANNLFRLIPKIKLDNFYLFLLLRYNYDCITVLASSSTMPAISFGSLKSFRLNLPPLQEQKAIAEILSTADKEIELLNKLLEYKKEEKKGLMQLLLTGIVRV